ncbi:hypothetical protein FNV34_13005 [Raoultella ornithinolytica]|nr:hypothetical protein FNV34_13005 [Raoultella ornithinolytica]
MVICPAAVLNDTRKPQKIKENPFISICSFRVTFCCSQFIRGVYHSYRSKIPIFKIELIDQSG